MARERVLGPCAFAWLSQNFTEPQLHIVAAECRKRLPIWRDGICNTLIIRVRCCVRCCVVLCHNNWTDLVRVSDTVRDVLVPAGVPDWSKDRRRKKIKWEVKIMKYGKSKKMHDKMAMQLYGSFRSIGFDRSMAIFTLSHHRRRQLIAARIYCVYAYTRVRHFFRIMALWCNAYVACIWLWLLLWFDG